MTLCVFEAAAKEAGIEDQREKLKSLGFHERASFDSFHHFLSRVKRAAASGGQNRNFFKLLTEAFEVVYGRKRDAGSLGMHLSEGGRGVSG